jgi:16S rRNA (uracil1498-N3)-methyltransferase
VLRRARGGSDIVAASLDRGNRHVGAVIPRLHAGTDLAAGLVVGLAPAQAHYLRNVLRLAAGAELRLFNARDGEFEARLDGIGKGWASVAVGEQRLAPAAEADLWLVFAPVKRARLDFLVEKATELGVSELRPVWTRRTIVERVNVERLVANAVEAAEQTGRLSVPAVREPEPLGALLEAWPASRPLLLCDETGGGVPLAPALERIAPPLAVLTGPEGGFDESELDLLRELPFVTAVGLGPRVLRADTAALAALAVVQAIAGDWPRSRRI